MATKENIPTAIEQLLMSIARTNYWAVQYGPNHPATFKHIHSLHSALSACLASEPENCLLLGVARDKFYYRDRSVGKGNELIRTMTEQLYVLGVATISFGPQLSAEGPRRFLQIPLPGHRQETGRILRSVPPAGRRRRDTDQQIQLQGTDVA